MPIPILFAGSAIISVVSIISSLLIDHNEQKRHEDNLDAIKRDHELRMEILRKTNPTTFK